MSELAATIRLLADEGPDAFYTGRIGEAIVGSCWLEEQDLADYEARWVEPIRPVYQGTEVIELPPPNQGVVALETLGLFERGEPSLFSLVESARLALEDGLARVRDGADVSALLSAFRPGQMGGPAIANLLTGAAIAFVSDALPLARPLNP